MVYWLGLRAKLRNCVKGQSFINSYSSKPLSISSSSRNFEYLLPRNSFYELSKLISIIPRRNIAQINADMLDSLPFFASGEIVRGFGRGSKELGIPTANYPLEVVKSLPSALNTGIYYGWANVDNGEVHKMVMSIGTNPYYDNKEKSMETHILHEFNRDLYGHLLKVCIVGYLRPERNFDSLDALIEAINNDIQQAKDLLRENEENRKLKESKFFTDTNDNRNKTSCNQNSSDESITKNGS